MFCKFFIVIVRVVISCVVRFYSANGAFLEVETLLGLRLHAAQSGRVSFVITIRGVVVRSRRRVANVRVQVARWWW